MGISRDLRTLTTDELLSLAVHHKLIRQFEYEGERIRLYVWDRDPLEMGRMEAALFLAGALAMVDTTRPEPPPPSSP